MFNGIFSLDTMKTIFIENFSLFMEGLGYTLAISVISTILGVVIAFFFAVVRNLSLDKRDSTIVVIIKIFARVLVKLYVDLFRGTPILVQAFIFYTVLSVIEIKEPIVMAVIIITLNTVAYLTEIIRSGINGIDKGQLEAARSLGLTHTQAMRKIILPQAFKNMLPALSNEIIVNIKETSILSVIGVAELMYVSNSAASRTYSYLESYMIAALIYLVTTIGATQLLYFVNKMLVPQNKGKKFQMHSDLDSLELVS